MPEPVAPRLPGVAVVVANHNYGHWLGGALRSVDAQDYPNKRVVVVDDGSTDNSWDTLRLVANLNAPTAAECAARPNTAYTGKVGTTPVLAYRFEKAGGPSRARNLAIKLAWPQAHVFSMLDADDEFLPGKLSKVVAKIMEDPAHIGGVYHDYDTVEESTGKTLREYKEPFTRERLMRECMIHSACTVTKPALEKSGLYDEAMRTCEDFDLWMRITEHFLILHIPESLMRVRVGGHNSTSTVSKEVWEQNWRRIAEKTRQRANLR